MQKHTYVSESLKNGRIMRWTIMPLRVFVAPMKFYSKQGQDFKYKQMVKRALDAWQSITKGQVSFNIVENLLESNVNIDWKRVERKALGHCYFSYDASNRLYGAEVAIGLTEGAVHADYMDDDEVYHTILHEIGHAIGLGHSPYKEDIMFTPHLKGINSISAGDALTVNWLYSLPQGATVAEISSKYGIGSTDIDEIIAKHMERKNPTKFEQVKNSIKPLTKNLLDETEAIGNLRKYHVALQNVNLPSDVKKFFNKPK